MAHFWGPSDTQLIPRGVRYFEKPDGAPHEVWKIDMPTGATQVTVNLYGAAGLTVTSNDTSVVANPIPESLDGDNRILRLAGATAGTTMIEVTDAGGAHWIHLQVHVVDPDPTRASPQSPSQGSAPGDPSSGGAAGTQEPVAELLGLIDKRFTDDELASKKVVVAAFNAQEVVNSVKTFLHAYRALVGRNLPARNAIFLPAHTFESGWGTKGPNAPIGNWFSVQLLNKDELKPLWAAFKGRGCDMDRSARDNRMTEGGPNSKPNVDNPIFKNNATGKIDVAGMINAELDLIYGAPKDAKAQPWEVDPVALFKTSGIAPALARSDMTATRFAQAIAASGYAGKGTPWAAAYPAAFAGSYTNVLTALKSFLGGPLTGASEGTKTWATATMADIAAK
jgi:hypothetical protein